MMAGIGERKPFMAKTTAKPYRLMRRLVWTVVFALLVLVSLPIWFPWVLKPVLRHFHLSYSDYDRIGYTRFTLSGVAGEWNNSPEYFTCRVCSAQFLVMGKSHGADEW